MPLKKHQSRKNKPDAEAKEAIVPKSGRNLRRQSAAGTKKVTGSEPSFNRLATSGKKKKA